MTLSKLKKNKKEQKKQDDTSVLHGFSSGAGQPNQIATMQRKLGIDAHCIHIGANRLGYKFDRIISDGSMASRMSLFNKIHSKYNAFHFYGFPFFYWKTNLKQYPFGYDLFMLKMMKKNVIMNFRGSEVRQQDIFEKCSDFSYADGEDHGLFKDFPSDEQRKYIEFCTAFATSIIVPDVELGSYVPGAKVIPRAIDTNRWGFSGPKNQTKPLILHAPTRRLVKGTNIIIDIIDKLKSKGLQFDFKLVENLHNNEAAKLYKNADIIIDQMRIGWHGVVSLEAMSLGKVAVCYIRDDLTHGLAYKGRLPLVNANPNNLEKELEKLIKNPALRQDIGNFARHYVEKKHDVKIVAEKFIKEYKKKPKPVTPEEIEMYRQLVCDQQIKLLRKQTSLVKKISWCRSQLNKYYILRKIRDFLYKIGIKHIIDFLFRRKNK